MSKMKEATVHESKEALAQFAEISCKGGAKPLVFFGPHRFKITKASMFDEFPGVLVCNTIDGGELAIALPDLIAVLEDEEP